MVIPSKVQLISSGAFSPKLKSYSSPLQPPVLTLTRNNLSVGCFCEKAFILFKADSVKLRTLLGSWLSVFFCTASSCIIFILLLILFLILHFGASQSQCHNHPQIYH